MGEWVGPAISKKSNTQVNTAPFLFRSIRRWVRQTLISLRLTLIIEFSQHACPIAHCKSFEGVFLTPHYSKLNFQHKKTIHIFSFAPTINYHYTPNSKYSKLEPCQPMISASLLSKPQLLISSPLIPPRFGAFLLKVFRGIPVREMVMIVGEDQEGVVLPGRERK